MYSGDGMHLNHTPQYGNSTRHAITCDSIGNDLRYIHVSHETFIPGILVGICLVPVQQHSLAASVC